MYTVRRLFCLGSAFKTKALSLSWLWDFCLKYSKRAMAFCLRLCDIHRKFREDFDLAKLALLTPRDVFSKGNFFFKIVSLKNVFSCTAAGVETFLLPCQHQGTVCEISLCSHTCNCDIFAASIFSYTVHTLAACDRDKFAHVAILSHVAWEGKWGNGGRGWDEWEIEKKSEQHMVLYKLWV